MSWGPLRVHTVPDAAPPLKQGAVTAGGFVRSTWNWLLAEGAAHLPARKQPWKRGTLGAGHGRPSMLSSASQGLGEDACCGCDTFTRGCPACRRPVLQGGGRGGAGHNHSSFHTGIHPACTCPAAAPCLTRVGRHGHGLLAGRRLLLQALFRGNAQHLGKMGGICLPVMCRSSRRPTRRTRCQGIPARHDPAPATFSLTRTALAMTIRMPPASSAQQAW